MKDVDLLYSVIEKIENEDAKSPIRYYSEPIILEQISDEDYFKFLCEESNKGNVFYMTNLGIHYLRKNSCKHDIEQYIYWIVRAANGKDPMGIHNLACIYREGIYTTQDHSKALELFSKAANLGVTRSINDIGVAYEKGLGVEVDYQKALMYYQEAAEKEDSSGLPDSNIAFLYYKGLGVEQDIEKALNHWCLAESKGYSDATETLTQVLTWLYIDGIKDIEDPDEEKANKAFQNILTAARYNHGVSELYAELNFPQVKSLFARRINDLVSFPQLNYIKKVILKIHGLTYADEKESWKGAERGEADELCYVGLILLFGNNMNNIDPIKYLKRSQELGFIMADFWLAYCYEKGLHCSMDIDKAITLYQKVIKNGYTPSMWIDGPALSRREDDRDTNLGLLESIYRLGMIGINKGDIEEYELYTLMNMASSAQIKIYTFPYLLLAEYKLKKYGSFDLDKGLVFAAAHQNDRAEYLMMTYHLNNNEKDKAFEYCNRAISHGSTEAIFALKNFYSK